MDDQVMKLLFDAQQAIDSILSFTKPIANFNEYKKNKLVRRAVERELEIVGEIMKRLRDKHPEISINGKDQIIGFRNRLSHGYDSVDDAIVWGILIRHIPVLKNEIDVLIG